MRENEIDTFNEIRKIIDNDQKVELEFRKLIINLKTKERTLLSKKSKED